jgi:hypothetical protein
MTTADDIVDLFREYSIYDQSKVQDAAAGFEVDVGKMKHRQLAPDGLAEAKIRRTRVRSADKIGHVELQENKGKAAKGAALKLATGHMLEPDGSLKPGVKPRTISSMNATLRTSRRKVGPLGSFGAIFHAAAVRASRFPLPSAVNLPARPCSVSPIADGHGCQSELLPTAALSGCSVFVSGTSRSGGGSPLRHEGKTDKSGPRAA